MRSPKPLASLLSAALLLVSAWGIPSARAAEPTALEIDREASRIAAHVKATGHRFDAVVNDYELNLEWNPDRETVVAARLAFDFADVGTGRSRRDREMRDWLDYDTHPEAVFVLEAIDEPDDGGPPLARGRLRLHGVEQEIAFPVSIERAGDRIRIRAETTLDHRDWDLEEIRALLFMTVDPELEIRIDVTGVLP